MQVRVRDSNGANERWVDLATLFTGVKPPTFPNISTAGGIDRETQLYTQLRKAGEPPANYHFTQEQLYNFLVAEFGLTGGAGGTFYFQQNIAVGAAQGLVTITHNLNSENLDVTVTDSATKLPVRIDWTSNSVNQIQLNGLGATANINILIQKS